MGKGKEVQVESLAVRSLNKGALHMSAPCLPFKEEPRLRGRVLIEIKLTLQKNCMIPHSEPSSRHNSPIIAL